MPVLIQRSLRAQTQVTQQLSKAGASPRPEHTSETDSWGAFSILKVINYVNPRKFIALPGKNQYTIIVSVSISFQKERNDYDREYTGRG